MDLDEWLGASKTEPEGGLLSQKLLKKLGLEGAGNNGLNTRTSADDTADDEQTASDSGEICLHLSSIGKSNGHIWSCC